MKRGRDRRRGRSRGRRGRRGRERGRGGRAVGKRSNTATSSTPQRKRGRPRRIAAPAVKTATMEWRV